jgi:hypothetical protein
MKKKISIIVVLLISIFSTFAMFQQKILADSEYPDPDSTNNTLLLVVIGLCAIAIILVSIVLLIEIRYRHKMGNDKSSDNGDSMNE